MEVMANDNGISPTVRKLAEKVGLKSTATIQGHLNRLGKQGYVTLHPTCPTIIRIVRSKKLVKYRVIKLFVIVSNKVNYCKALGDCE